MSFCSAFGQWDTTAHQQLPLFDMASWMPNRSALGVGSKCDIHKKTAQIDGLPKPEINSTGRACRVLSEWHGWWEFGSSSYK
jgi:hypothetical protein